MKYELALNGRTYEVEVELAEPMMMQEFQSYAPAPAAPAAPAQEAAPTAAPAAAPATPPVAAPAETFQMPGNFTGYESFGGGNNFFNL